MRDSCHAWQSCRVVTGSLVRGAIRPHPSDPTGSADNVASHSILSKAKAFVRIAEPDSQRLGAWIVADCIP